ncbi:lipocalin family protein [Puniceicoccales bacterium CK1056]|uniref:Type IV secretion system putative lipoprotein virB7 n=1 Tax=Oceanipulchritudo coccoides TaxID=2706888 RepID=A0A6B2M1U8_9BACT|nr:lipocalin family protein [Oceanipulchritudo coccoides]NDV62981.1 lipocalin family protein [Oceanipulchritudo coccoides]
MKKIFLIISLLAVLSGCNTFRTPEPIPMVDRVNLDQFMGKWYIVASTPMLLKWDNDAYNAVEMYERGAKRGIKITYQYNDEEPNGPLKTVTANAMVDNPGINTDWEVTYAWPFGTDYRIIYLESDYSVAVIANPDRKKVRVLSRQSTINAPLYSDIILYLQDLGFNVGNIRMISHR